MVYDSDALSIGLTFSMYMEFWSILEGGGSGILLHVILRRIPAVQTLRLLDVPNKLSLAPGVGAAGAFVGAGVGVEV